MRGGRRADGQPRAERHASLDLRKRVCSRSLDHRFRKFSRFFTDPLSNPSFFSAPECFKIFTISPAIASQIFHFSVRQSKFWNFGANRRSEMLQFFAEIFEAAKIQKITI